MPSQKQINANRQNACRSTGPKTVEGKAKSRLNAMKHGLTGREILIPGENPADFEALLKQLRDEFAPKSASEDKLVEQLAGVFWRLQRIPWFEAAILEAYRSHAQFVDVTHEIKLDHIPNKETVRSFPDNCGVSNDDMKKVQRCQADAFDAHKKLYSAVEQHQSPLAKFGRSLVIYGQGLEALGKLSRYESDLIRNLRSILGTLNERREQR